MISETWQPNALATTVFIGDNNELDMQPDLWGSSWNNTISASAATSADNKMVVLRIHSNSTNRVHIDVHVHGLNATIVCSGKVLFAPTLFILFSILLFIYIYLGFVCPHII